MKLLFYGLFLPPSTPPPPSSPTIISQSNRNSLAWHSTLILDLRNNRLSDNAVVAAMPELGQLVHLLRFDFSIGPATSDSVAIALVSACQRMQRLQSLQLSLNTRIGDPGAIALAALPISLPSLVHYTLQPRPNDR